MALKRTTTDTSTNCLKIVVYGKAGSRKTSLIPTAEAPVIISSEKGLLPLRGLGIPVFEVESMAELDEALAHVTKSKEASQWKTICIDSISDMGTQFRLSELKNPKHLSKDKKEIDKWSVFNAIGDGLTQSLRDLRDVKDKNVYIIAQEDREKDDNGRLLYQPSFPGKAIYQELPYLFDGVFNIRQYNVGTADAFYGLQTTSCNAYFAKDRSGKLDELEEPNLQQLFNKMLSG